MFKNKRATTVILIALFSVILFFEKKQFDENLKIAENADQAAVSRAAANSATDVKNPARMPDINDQNQNSPPPAGKDTPEDLKAFASWVQTEASNLENRSSNQAEQEKVFKQKAQTLTRAEISSLKHSALSTSNSANERIFATYLLTLGSETTNSTLADIAKKELSLTSPQPVHSTGETQLMQEKALRTMAIDELFGRAKKDPNLRTQFLQMAQQISDSALRQYALKRAEAF